MDNLKQLKRLIYKVDKQLERNNHKRAEQLFLEAWEYKCDLGEEILIEMDYSLMAKIYNYRSYFNPPITDTTSRAYGYYDSEYKQLVKQESDYLCW
ncbi:hypothetical protein Q7A53_05805 [Halobacillus rhizosphaerae]|uniref:hypothetical protein n=1 Tax=Halobacillus rhizosphaerae TaxID=3064889 RepID=UPI00398A9584